jgi:hypothetical protein
MVGTAAWFMPAALANAKQQSLYSDYLGFEEGTEATVGEVVDTIIPATKTSGAKELGVHLFVLKMIKDCSDKKDQQSFQTGLNQLDEYTKKTSGKSFAETEKPLRLQLLKSISKQDSSAPKELKEFLALTKKFTLQGYTTSEYFMTNIIPYQLVPGSFHGCVKVKASQK